MIAMPEIILPEVELNIHSPKDPIEVPVVENYIVTKESSPNYVRHITFDVSGTELEGRIKVGQAFGILPPGKDENGRDYKLRLYSMSSPSAGEKNNPGWISTTVKRVIEEHDNKLFLGVCSNYLSDLKPGDKVKMTGPSGKRFLLPKNAEDFNYVFFAAGTGIAPFRGMAMELMNNGYQNDMVLVFGCPYRTDVLYADYFGELARGHKNFHFMPSISREDRRADGTKNYVQTKLMDEAALMTPILQKENTLMYICGLKGMETGIYKALAQNGLTEYLEIREDLAAKDPGDWTWEEMKKGVKPSARSFVEVY